MEVLAYNQVKFASVIQNINQELQEKGERCMEMILTIDCDKNILAFCCTIIIKIILLFLL